MTGEPSFTPRSSTRRALDDLAPVLSALDAMGNKTRAWVREMAGGAAFALGPVAHLPTVIGSTMGDALGHVFREPGVFSEVTDSTVYYVTDAYLVHVTKSKAGLLVRWAMLDPENITFCPVAVEIKEDWSAFSPREWSLGGPINTINDTEILESVTLTLSLIIRCMMARRRLIDQGIGFNAFSGLIELSRPTKRRKRS